MLILLIAALLLILLYDAPRLIKEAMWKELIVLLLFWSIGSILAAAIVMGIELPNPTDIINAVFGPLSQ